ncbi:lysophospholipid acyltransferase family protein [Histidinibacterium aquaticum]|uniref:DUF374 domain-containing protein n=1 Tax=Histidinibacterium aquaticum TaxID=2613962 RepID=A0A5J5GPY8_9RHOB|nr:DUF374 domain-containing protein [Histidinibacterium aquaticum]KAA9010436.1 DUF374 domain-containing protein [Histidinibacterium aquaticum]
MTKWQTRAEDWLRPRLVRRYGAHMDRVAARTDWQRIGFEPWEELIADGKPFILAHWHGRLAMSAYLSTGAPWPLTGLAYRHPIARVLTDGLPERGTEVVHLSPRRSNTGALRLAVAALRKGRILGITPDGPNGPVHVPKRGVVDIAALTGVPIAPFSYSTSRKFVLPTWDSFLLPRPGGHGVMAFGAPITVPKRPTPEQEQSTLDQLARVLNELDADCDAAVSRPRG